MFRFFYFVLFILVVVNASGACAARVESAQTEALETKSRHRAFEYASLGWVSLTNRHDTCSAIRIADLDGGSLVATSATCVLGSVTRATRDSEPACQQVRAIHWPFASERDSTSACVRVVVAVNGFYKKSRAISREQTKDFAILQTKHTSGTLPPASPPYLDHGRWIDGRRVENAGVICRDGSCVLSTRDGELTWVPNVAAFVWRKERLLSMRGGAVVHDETGRLVGIWGGQRWSRNPAFGFVQMFFDLPLKDGSLQPYETHFVRWNGGS